MLEQRRLPHPSGGLDDHDSAVSALSRTQQGAQTLDLPIALEQWK
jgi:hypothetical protein